MLNQLERIALKPTQRACEGTTARSREGIAKGPVVGLPPFAVVGV